MKWNLKNRFLLPTLVTIVIGMVFLGVFFYVRTHSVFSRVIQHELQQLAMANVAHMSQWIRDRQVDIESWGRQQLYLKALADTPAGRTTRTFVDRQLKKIRQDYGYYENIVLADRNGTCIAMADPKGMRENRVSQYPYFKAAMEGRSHVSSMAHVSATTGELVFVISAPVRSGNRVHGVLFCLFRVRDFVDRFVSSIHAGSQGSSFLFRRNGEILADGATLQIMGPNILSHPFGREMMIQKQGVLVYELDGRSMTSAFHRLDHIGWALVVAGHDQEVLAPIKELGPLFVLMSIVIIMGVVFSILAISRSVVEPMGRLVLGVEKMGKGQLDHRIPLVEKGGIEELNGVARAVNEMARNLAAYQRQIQHQNQMLSQSKEELEQMVRERTRKLRAAEAEYRSLFENAVEGIFRIRPDGTYIHANPALARILGVADVEELSEFSPDRFTTPEVFSKVFAKVRKQGEVKEYETQMLKRDKTPFWCSLSIKSVRDDQEQLCYYEGSIRDLTEHMEKEKAFREKEAAIAANRLKSEFLANMSHEIRTPLNTVIGFCELLSSRSPRPDQQGYIKAINSAGKSLLTLINDILDLSKMEAGKFEINKAMISLVALLEDIFQMFSPVASEKGLGLELIFRDRLTHRLWLDEIRLRQVLVNLVGNAVKFTDKGGVTLSLTLETETHTRCRICIGIQDTGMGIQENQFQKIFQPFEQGDLSLRKRHAGIGLGLPICHRLVTAMGGEIQVESRPGRGSLFTVCLRDVEKGEMDPRAAALEKEADSQGGFRRSSAEEALGDGTGIPGRPGKTPPQARDEVRMGEAVGPTRRLNIDPTTLYPALGRYLRQVSLPRVKGLKAAMVVNEVTEFARDLYQLAQDHDCIPLKLFAQDLIQVAEQFDIHGIHVKLDEFMALEAGMETSYHI